MPINVIFLAKIAINNHFHIVSNKIQSYHNFFLTFSLLLILLYLFGTLLSMNKER